MAALARSAVIPRDLRLRSFSGCSTKSGEQSLMICSSASLVLNPVGSRRSRSVSHRNRAVVRAVIGRDAGRSTRASIFVGGFVLGGLIVGALGCIYAPQISRALAGTDRKDLMRKLPKFIYDEEKALERTRKTLAKKIEQLNSAIDNVSSQLQADESPNGTAGVPDEIEAAM